MTLDELLTRLPGRAVQNDSRAVQPGDVFVAVRGIRADGHAFVPMAVERGAAVLVVERAVDAPAHVEQVIVPDAQEALGVLAGAALGDPAKAMTLVGVTGTNGKTTTTYLVESILAAAGAKVGVIGTVAYRWPGGSIDAPYTTPTPQILHGALAQMRDAGCTHVVMEVTSSALAMQRVAGMRFAVAGFSNLTQDHLDVHGTMDAYRAAKALLFSKYLDGVSVVNIDDPAGAGMARGTTLRVSAEGREAEIRVVEQDSTVRGVTARIETPRGPIDVSAEALIGQYNVANIALAVGIGEALGLPHAAIAEGLRTLARVPGRVEPVPNGADLDIFVDYAHTPDALENVLRALRPLTKRRLICVFGCGGDRDPDKRPKMGAAVSAGADLAIVTSDNPRTEDPRAIIDQILPGVPRPFLVEPDRRGAIYAAIAEATPGDVVLIAGKGHEDYQIVGAEKHHFDDREEAAAACAARPRWTPAQIADIVAAPGAHADAPAITRAAIDSRICAPGDLYVAIRGEAHDGHAFAADALARGAVALLVEQNHTIEVDAGTPVIRVDDTRVALGRIAAAHRRGWDGKLVAITGSAGKTTTKELTRAALAYAGPTHAAVGSLNNETGVPLTLLRLNAEHHFAVVEMGMRGLGQIEYLTRIAEPDVAVVVNAGTAHIELLGSTDAIAQAKSEIWLGLREGGVIVRPHGDDRLARWANESRPGAPTMTFGEEDGADVQLVSYAPRDAGADIAIRALGEERRLSLQLAGKHAAIDACAALAAALAAGGSLEAALAGIAHAVPPSMRGEVVDVAGRHVIVDCYNANPASMAAALKTLAEHAGNRLAVVGDMLELGAFAPAAHRDAGALAASLGIGVIALGEHASAVAAAAGGETAAAPAIAAARALERTQPGDWILLKASRGMRLERVLEEMRKL